MLIHISVQRRSEEGQAHTVFLKGERNFTLMLENRSVTEKTPQHSDLVSLKLFWKSSYNHTFSQAGLITIYVSRSLYSISHSLISIIFHCLKDMASILFHQSEHLKKLNHAFYIMQAIMQLQGNQGVVGLLVNCHHLKCPDKRLSFQKQHFVLSLWWPMGEGNILQGDCFALDSIICCLQSFKFYFYLYYLQSTFLTGTHGRFLIKMQYNHQMGLSITNALRFQEELKHNLSVHMTH